MNGGDFLAWDTIWQVKSEQEEKLFELKKSLDLDPLLIKLLYNRGLDTAEKIRDFLDAKIDKLADPYLLKGMNMAVERIKKAKIKAEKIVIYGDYDVDGITSTASLMLYLSNLGIEADYYIPNRLEEGYGLNKTALAEIIKTKQADLIITVDCGIKAYSQAEFLAEQGVDLIITDHHTPDPPLPKAVAVINPKQKDCDYPTGNLAGVALAFKLITALQEKFSEKDYEQFIAIATLGIVADVVPLVKENRIITKNGLKLLNGLKESKIENYGLEALLEVSGYKDKTITSGSIGYIIAPRINAAGRMGQADLAVELFLSSDYKAAKEIANQLNKLNSQRQEISQRILEQAEAEIKKLDLTEEWVFVVAGKDWHTGVIGNVASDLNEKYHRPVVLISLNEDKGTASARSIKGYHLYQALKANEDLLVNFGGHSQAAGLTIKADKIEQLRKEMNIFAKKKLTRSDLNRKIKLDSELNLSEIDFELVNKLVELEPFGCRNPGPKFLLSDGEIKDFKQVGKNNSHLKLEIKNKGQVVDAIAFNMGNLASLISDNKEVSLVFTPEINSWRGRKKLQLKIKDIRFKNLAYIQQLFAKQEQLLAKDVETELFKTDKFDLVSKIKLDKLNLVDQRDKIKTDTALLELLADKANGLIYVNDRKKSIELTKKLVEARGKDDLIFYDAGLDLKDRVRILTAFKSGDYKWLIINDSFDYRLKQAEFELFLFYTPPLAKTQLQQLFALSENNQIKSYYLSYNRSDLKQGVKLLTDLSPDRDLLVKIYIFFYKLKNAKGLIDKTKLELVELFNQQSKDKITLKTIKAAVVIFKELELISLKDKQAGFSLLDNQDKLDLASSNYYLKAKSLREEFEQFKGVLSQKLDKFNDYLKQEILIEGSE